MLLLAILKLEYDDGPWRVKVHTAHGNVPNAQKHVHLTRKKLSGEYSWNVDGSRHDAHRYPASEQMIGSARDAASKALNVPASSLQFVTSAEGPARVSIATLEDGSSSGRSLAKFTSLQYEMIVVFAAENQIVVIRTSR